MKAEHSSGGPVLITGASSGIGLGMAERFLAQGHRVFGSVRSQDRARALEARLGRAFTPLVFDICDGEQLAGAADELERHLAGESLAALINNAGSAEIGPLLHVPLDAVRRQLDVLVVGQLAVIQRFHRHLLPGASGRRPGRILNISSLSGTIANRYFGSYVAGKHALEGLSKTLRIELQGLGIPVVVVAPGNIATAIWSKQTTELIEPYRDTPDYAALQGAVQHFSTTTMKQAMGVAEFSDALYRIFAARNPAPRYTVVKSKRRRVPLSRLRVRILKG